MSIKKSHLTALGVKPADTDKFLSDLNEQMAEHQIDTKLRIAHFLAQVLHESSRMKRVQENMFYRENRLLEVFRKYFTPQQARAYAGKPKMIGSRVYANRMGNGDEASGDGFRYRGRGLIQLTGKNNYRDFSDWVGDDVVEQPDLVATNYAVHSAIYYWTQHDLNRFADHDNLKEITIKINGGTNGLSDRSALLDQAKQLLDIEVAPELLEEATHSVTASSLNMRSRTEVLPSTRICSLPEGTKVAMLESVSPKWAKVRAVLNGHLVEGFVASKYLRQLPKPPKPVDASRVKPKTAKHQLTHVVNASSLNFRSQPVISSTNIIGSLDLDTKVEKISDAPGEWLKIKAVVKGKIKEGYVFGKFLKPLAEEPVEPILVPQDSKIDFEIRAVHLKQNKADVTRRQEDKWAFPLGEANRPSRVVRDAKSRVNSILKIINYLDSENPQHQRYQPNQRATYCNIYAYDVCYLAGVYLPRVWWTDRALLQLKDDVAVPVQYGKTVREMNANMLHDWFEDYGDIYGWKRVFDLDVLQAAANSGAVCIIVAQRQNMNHSGHITVVAPEHDGFAVPRSARGEVKCPLESQAGRHNHRFVIKNKPWWKHQKFRKWGFWRHV